MPDRGAQRQAGLQLPGAQRAQARRRAPPADRPQLPETPNLAERWTEGATAQLLEAARKHVGVGNRPAWWTVQDRIRFHGEYPLLRSRVPRNEAKARANRAFTKKYTALGLSRPRRR